MMEECMNYSELTKKFGIKPKKVILKANDKKAAHLRTSPTYLIEQLEKDHPGMTFSIVVKDGDWHISSAVRVQPADQKLKSKMRER